MGRLIANMVARNEEFSYLPQVLERLSHQVDEIIFTDDASTDNTVELASKYTKNIQVLSAPLFSTDEGALRQRSWDFLCDSISPTPHDWVLAIDADELLYETTYSLRDIIVNEDHDIANIDFYHMWNETHYRTDGGWRPHGSTRLFRWMPDGKFKERKLAPGSEPIYVDWIMRHFPSRYMRESGLKIKHLSYIKDEDKQAKYDRYVSIDNGAYHASSHINSIIDTSDKVSLEEWSES
jgi:glycosyltransferase involved in cell wall biosynthesis